MARKIGRDAGKGTGPAGKRADAGNEWLRQANDAFDASDSYVRENWRSRWDRNVSLFNSEHPSGSKYHHESYRYRSKIFRPKTRSIVRKNEAAAAAAFFSNQDVVNIEPENPRDPYGAASAAIVKELVQYRLTKTIPWFQLVIGAVQDAQVMNACCSRQEWDMVSDRPVIELVPLENMRFAPDSDWTDPVQSSPYLIELLPMRVLDVRERMGREQNPWLRVTDDVLRQATQPWDSTGEARISPDANPYGDSAPLPDYETVWVRRVIMRQPDGRDLLWYTAGEVALLSEPVPLEDVYFHGRPYVWGVVVIEAHHVLPKGPVELGEQLQVEANELANTRLDNVKLVLNKRWIAKRGSQVDLQSLMLNAAGSVTLANDPERDVREVNWPDITASAYAEQDRVNVDFDELLGNFSSGSVLTNRKMNETVGGMQMIAGGASQLTEYLLRTFTETWAERVLRQLVKLEQKYETDEVVLSLAADKAQLFQRYGISVVTDELLDQELTLTVNVGMGSTDPQQKVQKLMMGVQAMSVATQNPGLNGMELAKEIFGYLGWRDGGRFISDQQNPAMMQAQQAMNAMQQELMQLKMQLMAKRNDMDAEVRARVIREQHRLDSVQKQLEVAKIGIQAEASKVKDDRRLLEIEKVATQNQLAAAEELARIEAGAKQKELATAETVATLKVRNEIERGAADVAAREREAVRSLQLEKVQLDMRAAAQQEKDNEPEDDGEDSLQPVLATMTEISRQVQDAMRYLQAPRRIVKDADGNAVSVEIEGFESRPVTRDRQGNVTVQ